VVDSASNRNEYQEYIQGRFFDSMMLFSINKHHNKGEALFSDPDSPLCLRFWTHMYGNGIGTLSILLKDTRENKEREIWSLSGEAGNAWYQAELPISSPNQFMVRTEI